MKRTLTTLTVAATMFTSSASAFDPDDLQKLKDTGNCYQCDLAGAVLSFADLWSANLRGTNLRGASLIGADLGEANLAFANLEDANLGGGYSEGCYSELYLYERRNPLQYNHARRFSHLQWVLTQ